MNVKHKNHLYMNVQLVLHPLQPLQFRFFMRRIRLLLGQCTLYSDQLWQSSLILRKQHILKAYTEHKEINIYLLQICNPQQISY